MKLIGMLFYYDSIHYFATQWCRFMVVLLIPTHAYIFEQFDQYIYIYIYIYACVLCIHIDSYDIMEIHMCVKQNDERN